MSQSIIQLVDQLPQGNITVKVLKALDFVAPGEWQNTVGFDQTIRVVTGEQDPVKIQRIRERALTLYEDPKAGYKSAISLYQIIDKADAAMATAALANKIGEKIEFLSFLNKVTPKADTAQTIDLVLKIVIEIIAFCKINGLPKPDLQVFVNSLKNNYSDAALLRMGALVCLDGILPLGPDFLSKIHAVIDGGDESLVKGNPVFQSISGSLPGDNPHDKFSFISQSFTAVQEWMEGLISKTGMTPSTIFQKIGSFIKFTDDNLDVVAAFVDQTTNYYEHTGIQSVARSLIIAAHTSIQNEPEPVSILTSEILGSDDYPVGTKVDAYSENDEGWYAGSVREVQGDLRLIRYLCDNNPSDDEWISKDSLLPAGSQYEVGSEISVLYSDGDWYEATILEIKGDTYLVEYTVSEEEEEEAETEWVAWEKIGLGDE